MCNAQTGDLWICSITVFDCWRISWPISHQFTAFFHLLLGWTYLKMKKWHLQHRGKEIVATVALHHCPTVRENAWPLPEDGPWTPSAANLFSHIFPTSRGTLYSVGSISPTSNWNGDLKKTAPNHRSEQWPTVTCARRSASPAPVDLAAAPAPAARVVARDLHHFHREERRDPRSPHPSAWTWWSTSIQPLRRYLGTWKMDEHGGMFVFPANEFWHFREHHGFNQWTYGWDGVLHFQINPHDFNHGRGNNLLGCENVPFTCIYIQCTSTYILYTPAGCAWHALLQANVCPDLVFWWFLAQHFQNLQLIHTTTNNVPPFVNTPQISEGSPDSPLYCGDTKKKIVTMHIILWHPPNSKWLGRWNSPAAEPIPKTKEQAPAAKGSSIMTSSSWNFAFLKGANLDHDLTKTNPRLTDRLSQDFLAPESKNSMAGVPPSLIQDVQAMMRHGQDWPLGGHCTRTHPWIYIFFK